MSDIEKKDDNWIPQSYPIPTHWIYTELETVFENLPLTGKKLAQKDYDTAGKIPVIDQGVSEIGGYSNYQEKVVTAERPVIIFGDHTKCLKYITYPFIPGADGIKVLLPNLGVDPKFAFYACTSLRLPDRGYSRHFSFLKKCDFPLPPLNEQKRIVTKIEELFSELDNGIAALKTAREQLKVYRQAVLKHAFEGKLTAKWREENADKLESPEQLLARIQQEREARYQEQLEDWKAAVKEWEANGKEGKKPGKPKKTKVLSGKLVDEIIIPNEWSFSIIGELNAEVFDGPFGSNLKSSDYVDRGVRVIRLENIGEMRFIEDKYSFITEEKYQTILKHTVSGGDIIFSSFMTEGIRVIILPESVDKAVNKADCFCVRMFGESYNPRFLVLYLSSRAAYKQIESEIHGIGRPRINTTQLKSFVVPICSIDEQIQILSEIEQQISEIDATESNIDAQIERAKTLRQSILKKAFSGQLVPQDPSDEPASKLLARIQAEKEFVNTQKTSESNKRHSVSSH